MSINGEFPREIFNDIEYYVYRLVDPRDGQTFYVGKGLGNRVFEHAKGALKSDDKTIMSLKLSKIEEIQASGEKVKAVIHRWGINSRNLGLENISLNETTVALDRLSANIAYVVEAAVIDAYGLAELTNEVGGHKSDEYGEISPQELIGKFTKEEVILEKDENVLFLNISKTFPRRKQTTRKDIFEAARLAWPIDQKKIKKVNYVLAHREGVVIAVFGNLRWADATLENFPDMPDKVRLKSATWKHMRRGFHGDEIADGPVAERYIGKRVPNKCRKAQKGVCYYP